MQKENHVGEIMKKEVYFDHASASVPEKQLMELFTAESLEFFANSEAIHALAYRGRKAVLNAGLRISLALFGRDDYPVIWGNSATELFRLLAVFPEFSDSVTSVLEHPALLANLNRFTNTRLLPAASDGAVRIESDVSGAELGCFHQVQSELGIIQDTAGLFTAAAPGCRMIDAVQAAGKIPLAKAADVWVISGVKFGAPGGAAMLLAPQGRFTEKLLKHASEYRHHDYAVGRVTVPVILTMARALENAVENMTENFRRVSQINAFIRSEVQKFDIFPTMKDGVQISPYILNLMLPYQESAVVVRALGEYGVYAASGSACSAESSTPSAALTALGFNAKKAFRALRLSFGAANSMEDAEIFISALKTVLKNY